MPRVVIGPALPDRASLDNEIARLRDLDRKSTRLNSSHLGISYAVFCLKKKNNRLRGECAHVVNGTNVRNPAVMLPEPADVREEAPVLVWRTDGLAASSDKSNERLGDIV